MSCVSNQKISTNLFLDIRLDFDIHKLGHVDSVCYALINLLLVRLRLKLSIFNFKSRSKLSNRLKTLFMYVSTCLSFKELSVLVIEKLVVMDVALTTGLELALVFNFVVVVFPDEQTC